MEETVEESTNNMFDIVKAAVKGSSNDIRNTQAVTEKLKNKRFGSFEEAFHTRVHHSRLGTTIYWYIRHR